MNYKGFPVPLVSLSGLKGSAQGGFTDSHWPVNPRH
jgi:hypothetical protein